MYSIAMKTSSISAFCSGFCCLLDTNNKYVDVILYVVIIYGGKVANAIPNGKVSHPSWFLQNKNHAQNLLLCCCHILTHKGTLLNTSTGKGKQLLVQTEVVVPIGLQVTDLLVVLVLGKRMPPMLLFVNIFSIN